MRRCSNHLATARATLAGMGKLAARLTDATRSGVYRVAAASVPRAAASEAKARVIETSAAALCGDGGARLRQALGVPDARACLLLVTDATAVDAGLREQMVAALGAIARTWRDRGRSFFAVWVDPEGKLDLPPLYRE